jgi:hypothetical protein
MNNDFVDCPLCDGAGRYLFVVTMGPICTRQWLKCEFCEGAGGWEKQQYMLMKLAGEV